MRTHLVKPFTPNKPVSWIFKGRFLRAKSTTPSFSSTCNDSKVANQLALVNMNKKKAGPMCYSISTTHHDGASGIDDVATWLAGVNRGQQQLLLKLSATHNVVVRLARFHGRIARNNTGTGAWRIHEHPVEVFDYFRYITSVFNGQYDVLNSQPMTITDYCRRTFAVHFVGDDDA